MFENIYAIESIIGALGVLIIVLTARKVRSFKEAKGSFIRIKEIDLASRVQPRQPEAQLLVKKSIFDVFKNRQKNSLF